MLLSLRCSVLESLAPNINFCSDEWLLRFLLKVLLPLLIHTRPAVTSLFNCRCLSVCFWVYSCLFHVEKGTCFITVGPLAAISPVEPRTHPMNANVDIEIISQLSPMGLHVHWNVWTRNSESHKTTAQRKCEEAVVVWSLWQQTGHSGECRSRVLGTENRPLYGEMMQTLIPMALWKTILGHYELSHARTTILGLVHLFIFYVFPLMNPKRRMCVVVFGL